MENDLIERVAMAIFDVAVEKPLGMDLRPMARAAIAAVREPTAEMLFVGSNDDAGFTERNLLESWHLMIDEALSGPE